MCANSQRLHTKKWIWSWSCRKIWALLLQMKAPPRWCLKKYLCYFHPSFGEEFHFVRILFYNWVETNAYKSYFNEIFCSRWMRSTSTSLGKQVVGPPIAVFRVVSLRLKFNNMRLRWSRLKPVWGISVDGWPPMWWFSTFHDFWRESAWFFFKSSEKNHETCCFATVFACGLRQLWDG